MTNFTVVKKQKNKAKSSPVSKGMIITVAIMAAAVAGGVYYLWITAIPVNVDHPVFQTASNVHTRHLKYFEAQTINCLADKEGTYSYYSVIHPEMKGTLTVDP